ncbi:DNA methyltransferase [Nannocystaceae bacterium ST9]
MSGSSPKTDPELRMHKEWLGLLQPVGLVVSPLALIRKQAIVDRDGAVRLQALLRPLVDATDPLRPALLRDLPGLFEQVLGWASHEYLGGEPDSGRPPLPDSLEVRLPELDELLRPTFAVPDVPQPDAGPDTPPRWLLLVEELPARTPLDEAPKDGGRGWHVSAHAKFERMLWELDCPIGLLCNGELLRLVYAPRGETSGHLSFPIGAMTEVANRPMLGALHMLLSADRLLGQSDDRRLPALLHESRRYQNEVSTELAEQVLGALLELLRGFQAADESAQGELLGANTAHDPMHVYGGLLTVLLRLVFLLFAEDRGLLPDDPTWSGNYAVVGLFERLREDAGRYPDTMDQRYGAWAWLLTLFRLVFLGGGHGPALHLPARKGQLFDPGAYPFLEGRTRGSAFEPGERLDPPRVSDGTIFRVLQGLLVLDGERLSYRSLDVEQIGSVYESMMGYEVEKAKGPSIGLGKQHVVVDLAALLAEKPKDRAKWLDERASVKLSEQAQKQLQGATTPEQAVAALQRRISKRTPTILPKGALYLQPGEERRRTGSHYTPRSLTEPIVRITLRPILEDLGPTPTEAQVLALKVCDPAMGSGAFLVEACRQLAEVLVEAWRVHGTTRTIPVDEIPRLHARRLVAEHCLYGVDKNPFAVNLAKLSLWLATLAKDHPFTFLDHALKCGDSLVGLTRRQIAEFRWNDQAADDGPLFARVREQVVAAVAARLRIREEGEDADDAKRMWNAEAERALEDARLQGDAVIAAFFAEEKPKEREKRRVQLWDLAQRWHGGIRGRGRRSWGPWRNCGSGAWRRFTGRSSFPRCSGRGSRRSWGILHS